MGEVVLFRDFQNPKDIERMQRELEKEAAAILVPFVETTGFTEIVPYGGAGIDGMELGKE